MSNNQREKGKLILPAEALVPLRKALVEAMNIERAKTLELALKVYELLRSDAAKETRNALGKLLKQRYRSYQESELISKLAQSLAPADHSGWRHSPSKETEAFYRRLHRAVDLIIPYQAKEGEARKVRSPKKKDLPPLPAVTWQFEGDECTVSIDPKARTLYWEVQENNHSVDRAWESSLGKALDQALSQVKWTRGSGGRFIYSDEYMRDADWESGGDFGSTSASRRYGPLGEEDLVRVLVRPKARR